MAPKIWGGWPFRVWSEFIDTLICMFNVKQEDHDGPISLIWVYL